MIELEIQGLSATRDGLLIEVGRLVMACGFSLQRQRLVQDPHGILLTMIVRGPSRGRKSLQVALDGYERFISARMFPWVDGESTPHFGASLPRMAYVPPPLPAAPAPELPATPTARAWTDAAQTAGAAIPAPTPPLPEPEFDFIQPTPRPPAPARAPVVDVPFVELVPLAADEPAVETLLRALDHDYPDIGPQLLALQQSVAEAARASSLALAGRGTGSWVFQREYSLDDGLDLGEAIERIGVPALRALVEVDQQGNQLHIHDSPLCGTDGRSGCGFFGGFLEGLLEPVIAPASLTIFPVCCRSYGAEACVLDLSD